MGESAKGNAMQFMERLGVVNSDNGKRSRQLTEFLDKTVSLIAVIMTLYHLYTALWGTPEWLIHRPLHVAFFLSIGFLTYKSGKRRDNTLTIIRDILFSLASVGVYLYILYHFKRFSTYMFMVTKLTPMDFFVIGVIFFLVLEMTRRTTGWSIIIVAAVFIGYTLYAKYFPVAIRGASVSLKTYLSYMFCTSDGLYGSTVNIASSYVFLFIVFGVFLEQTGVGEYFIDFATTCTSRLRGGPAKASILASGLFGSISGSAVANVYATGTFTIPLMKKAGFKNDVAGATEAVASSGGAIMPPVMGSTAFLMADFLGVSYAAICRAALIPALLYYLSLWLIIDLEAYKLGMKKGEKARVDWTRFIKKIYLASPVVVIIVAILMGRSIFRSAFMAIIATIIVGLIHDYKCMSPRNILSVLDKSARSSVSISAPLTCAAIVVGTINLTGVGLKLTALIIRIAGDSLPGILFLTMIVTIILGMGLPTPAAYMLVAIFAPSAMIQYGVPVLTSHMFCFYYAAFSTITPPVAMAAYAGGNLAGASASKTGFTAVRLGIAAFIIPWIFVYSDSLLLQGSALSILQAIVTALIGVYALAAGMQGVFFEKRINVPMRIVALICALCMIISGTMTDLIGLVLLAVLIAYSRTVRDKSGDLRDTK